MTFSYLTLLPSHLRQYFYANYLTEQLNIFWRQFSAIASCVPLAYRRCGRYMGSEEDIALHYLIYHNYLRILKTFTVLHSKIDSECIGRAIAEGHIDMVHWLLQYIAPIHLTHNLMITAARRGNLVVLQDLLDHGCPIHINTLCEAAQSNRLQILQWVYQQQPVKPAYIPSNSKRTNAIISEHELPQHYPRPGVSYNAKHCSFRGLIFEPRVGETAEKAHRENIVAWLQENNLYRK